MEFTVHQILSMKSRPLLHRSHSPLDMVNGNCRGVKILPKVHRTFADTKSSRYRSLFIPKKKLENINQTLKDDKDMVVATKLGSSIDYGRGKY